MSAATAEIATPCLHQSCLVFAHKLDQLRQFSPIIPEITGDAAIVQPQLCEELPRSI
jgi:hypothetical protein